MKDPSWLNETISTVVSLRDDINIRTLIVGYGLSKMADYLAPRAVNGAKRVAPHVGRFVKTQYRDVAVAALLSSIAVLPAFPGHEQQDLFMVRERINSPSNLTNVVAAATSGSISMSNFVVQGT